MPLSRPRVIGPVSELSRKVRVKGQIIGADVVVVSLGGHRREITRGKATASDQRFDLPANSKLLANDTLVAVQTFGGESSASPSESMEFKMVVMSAPARPSELGSVNFESALFACGRAIWLKGGFPGADAHVKISGVVAGTGTFFESEGARFTLSTPLSSTTTEASQSVPGLGNGPPVQRIPVVLAGKPGDPVMAPRVDPSPVSCDEAIHVTHVIDGAEVVLTRSDGRTSTELRALFDLDALWFPLGKPLSDIEQIALRQEVALDCKRTSITRNIPVGTAPTLLPPSFPDPLCAGSTSITIVDLHQGARVQLNASGTIFEAQTPEKETTLEILIDPPLIVGTATVRQFHCNQWSDWSSPPTPINPAPASVPRPTVVEPLYSCRSTVDVKDTHAGGFIQVVSKFHGTISDWVPCHGPLCSVEIAPLLDAGDDIHVEQRACGINIPSVNIAHVVPHPDLTKPITQLPLFIGAKKIHFDGLIPGATLVVEVRDGKSNDIKYVVHHIALDTSDDVDLTDPLAEGDTLTARQSMCNDLSPVSDAAAATHIPITSDWWAWDDASPTVRDWNREYTIAGTFTNKGNTPLDDVHFLLFENASSPGDITPGHVEPNATTRGAFPQIKQSWSWLTPAVWTPHDKPNKSFVYIVNIDAKDEQGHSYPTITSAPLLILVKVSGAKRLAAAIALEAGVTAVALTVAAATFFAGIITAAIGASLLVAAGIAAAVSAASGALALDPPAPDPNFRQRTPLPARETAPALGNLSPLAALFLTIKHVMTLEEAKSVIESRRLGAVQAGDPRWAALHAQDLSEAVPRQIAAIAEVQSSKPAAISGLLQIMGVIPPDVLTSQRHQLLVSGIPPSFLIQAPLPADQVAALMPLVQSADIAYPTPDVIAAIEETVANLVALSPLLSTSMSPPT